MERVFRGSAILLLLGVAIGYGAGVPSLPSWFEANEGQVEGGWTFLGRARGYVLAVDATGATALLLPSGESYEEVRLRLEGSRPVPFVAEERRMSITRYYAPGAAWSRPHFARLRAPAVYPGIDFVWKASGAAFSYEFHVRPHADPGRIGIRFEGARSLTVSSGELVVRSPHGEVRYRQPVAFQDIGGEHRTVTASYRIDGDSARIELGPYDPREPLVIDPVVMSTYVGGSGFDAVNAVATDTAGNLYIAGETASTNLSSRPAMSRSAFIAELTPDVGLIKYVTILISGGNDRAAAVAVDAAGNAYIAGTAGNVRFPVTSNALTATAAAAPVGFVSKLGPTGQLLYSTLLGRDNTTINALALDSSADVYVAGTTGSVAFPATSNAPQRQFAGALDGFVARLNLSKPALVYATLVGGAGIDSIAGVAVSSGGVACIAGSTASTGVPVKNAAQPALGGGQDALVGCLNPAGDAWTFLTYWGGPNTDIGAAVTLDPAGNVVVAGATMSASFPKAPAAIVRDYDAFVSRFRADGSAVFSTILGGAGADAANAVAVDPGGFIWVAGQTGSVDFPQKLPLQSGFAGVIDGFVAELAADGSSVLFSTCIGGSGEDRVLGLAVKQSGMVAVAGLTGSTDLPVSALAGQRASAGGYDAFVTVVSTRISVYTPAAFTAGAWQLDANGNRSWDSAADISISLGEAGDTPLAGDWNGDGRTKTAIFRDGLWVMDYNGNGRWDGPGSDRFFYLGQRGDIPLVGDWNGDGRAKAGIFRAGLWVLDYNGNGQWDGPSIDRFFYLGAAGDTPVVGDWNTDGRAKGGIFRAGLWVLDYNGNGQWDGFPLDRFFYLGQQGDTPVVGDWNGDGRAKGGVFRAGLWVLDYNGNGVWDGAADRAFTMGKAGDIPVIGDWTGDGRSKAAVFSRGVWLFDLSGDGAVASANFGSATSLPLVGRWQ